MMPMYSTVRWHTVVRTSHLFVPLICDLGILYLRQRVISGCRGKKPKKIEFRRDQHPGRRDFITNLGTHNYCNVSIHHICLRSYELDYTTSTDHDSTRGTQYRQLEGPNAKCGFPSGRPEPESDNDFECTRPQYCMYS